MRVSFYILLMGFALSCVKDEKVPSVNTAGSTGGSGGGTPVIGSDPLAVYAWHIKNTGQTSFSTGTGLSGEDINLEEAHALGYRGKNIRIAVSDSGVEHFHPDLQGNQLVGEHRNYYWNESSRWHNADPMPDMTSPHGTSVTGLIAAIGWNNIGSRGVAPDAKFAAFKFLSALTLTATTDSYLARFYDQLDGDFDIFNYSYGSIGCDFKTELPLEHEALLNGVLNLRDGKGAIYVQAAGNGYNWACNGADNTNRDPSLASPYKIVVGATNASGQRSSYSTPGSSIWVSAPGGEYGTTSPAMITTDITGCNLGYSYKVPGTTTFNEGYNPLNLSCDYTSKMNGTSSATPITSGVVALMLEANPELTWRDVKNILASTSDKIDYSAASNDIGHPDGYDLSAPYVYEKKWITNFAGYNFSNWYGFGRINAQAAVEKAKSYVTNLGTFGETKFPDKDDWYYDSGAISRPIPSMDSYGISSTIKVLHNYNIEAVQIRITTDHTAPGELAVHLISPKGTESRLLNLNNKFTNTSLDADYLMISNAFYGEPSYGDWTLKIYDGTPLISGTLTNWKINILGSLKVVAATPPAMPGVLTLDSVYASYTTAPTVSFTHSTSTSVIRYEMSVGTTAGATDKAKWTSIGYNTSYQMQNLMLVNRSTYYVNIRAVDINEQVSGVRSKAWTVIY